MVEVIVLKLIFLGSLTNKIIFKITDHHSNLSFDGHVIARKFFSSQNASSYDLVAKYTTFGKDSTWKKHIVEHIEEYHKCILDLACGTGICSTFIKSGNLDLYGADLTFDYILKAKKRMKYSFLTNSIAEFLPFKSNMFDLVFSSYLAKYANIKLLVEEIWRITKKNGSVVFHDFTFPNNIFMKFFWHKSHLARQSQHPPQAQGGERLSAASKRDSRTEGARAHATARGGAGRDNRRDGLACRDARQRNRQPHPTHAVLRERARRGAQGTCPVRSGPHAGDRRALVQVRAVARHRQGRRARRHPAKARQADGRRVRGHEAAHHLRQRRDSRGRGAARRTRLVPALCTRDRLLAPGEVGRQRLSGRTVG